MHSLRSVYVKHIIVVSLVVNDYHFLYGVFNIVVYYNERSLAIENYCIETSYRLDRH